MAVHTVWTEKCTDQGTSPGQDPATPGHTRMGERVESQHAGGDPVAALRRIAFLLERRLADSYRIKAYRAAAATLLTLSAEEVRSRAAAGTLRELPGIGAKTAAIVEDCVSG